MKSNLKKNVILLSVGLIVASCSFNPQEVETVKRGKAIVAADESLRPIVEAQVQAYQVHYPDAEFVVKFMPEQEAINLLLSDSADVAVTTRELNKKELVYYEQTGINYEPAIMALDAVTLIVGKGTADTTITTTELKEIFTNGKSSTKNLIFDNSNSSNLSYLKNKLQISDVTNANISAANGNLDVFNYVNKNKNSIGVVGNNWLSDLDNAESKKLRNSVRILAVSEGNSSAYFLPNASTLQQRKYPLERLIYLHTNQTKWKVAKGFIRFSCSQVGQLVVEKMGLLPFYVIPKEYYLDNRSLNKVLNEKGK